MKKLLIAITTLLVLVAAAIVVVPSFIDWNAYRGTLVRQLGLLTGRAVAVDGAISFSMLPTPTLSVEKVRLANPAGAVERDLLSLDALDARVRFLPLLTGRLDIEALSLIGATLTLEVLPDGRKGWLLSDATTTVVPQDISIGEMTLRDASVVYRDMTGDIVRSMSIDQARVTTESLRGPSELIGRFRIGGRPVDITVEAGRTGSNGATPVRLTAESPDKSVMLQFAGINIADDSLRFQGDVSIEATALDSLLDVADIDGFDDTGEDPVNLRATVTAAPELVSVERIRGEAAGSAVEGAFTYVPRSSVTPTASLEIVGSLDRLALDPIVEGQAGSAFEFLANHDIDLLLDVSASSFTARDGRGRNLEIDATVDRGNVDLRMLKAILPGSTDTVVTGTIDGSTGEAGLSVALASNNARAFLEWAGFDTLNSVPADRLRRLEARGRLDGTRDSFTIRGLDLILDSTKIEGGVAITRGDRLGIGMRVDIDQFNADAYGLSLADDLPWSDVLLPYRDVLDNVDANLDVTVGQLAINDISVQGLDFDAILFRNTVDISRLAIGQIADATIEAEGRLSTVAPMTIGTLDFTATIGTPSSTARLLGVEPPRWVADLGEINAGGTLSGDAETLVVDTTIDTSGILAETGVTISRVDGNSLAKGSVRVRHDAALDVLTLLEPRYEAVEQDLGPLDLYTDLVADSDGLDLALIEGVLGPVSLAGNGAIDVSGVSPTVNLVLRTSDIPMDLMLPTLDRDMRLPGQASVGWYPLLPLLDWVEEMEIGVSITSTGLDVGDYRVDDVAFEVQLTPERLVLEHLDGAFEGGQIGARGTLERDRGSVEGTVDVTAVNIQLRDALEIDAGPVFAFGTLDGDLSAILRGDSEQGFLSTLVGDGDIVIRDGVLQGLDFPALTAGFAEAVTAEEIGALAQTTLIAGETPFEQVRGRFRIDNGTVSSDDFLIAADAGRVEGRGAVDLVNANLDFDVVVRPAGIPGAPALDVQVSGEMDEPDRVADVESLSAWLARRRPSPEPPPTPDPPAETEATPAAIPAPDPEPGVPVEQPAIIDNNPSPDENTRETDDLLPSESVVSNDRSGAEATGDETTSQSSDTVTSVTPDRGGIFEPDVPPEADREEPQAPVLPSPTDLEQPTVGSASEDGTPDIVSPAVDAGDTDGAAEGDQATPVVESVAEPAQDQPDEVTPDGAGAALAPVVDHAMDAGDTDGAAEGDQATPVAETVAEPALNQVDDVTPGATEAAPAPAVEDVVDIGDTIGAAGSEQASPVAESAAEAVLDQANEETPDDVGAALAPVGDDATDDSDTVGTAGSEQATPVVEPEETPGAVSPTPPLPRREPTRPSRNPTVGDRPAVSPAAPAAESPTDANDGSASSQTNDILEGILNRLGN